MLLTLTVYGANDGASVIWPTAGVGTGDDDGAVV